MKKSVVIPYERYQQLLKQQQQPDTTPSDSHREAERAGVKEEETTSTTPTTSKLNPSVIIACLPKRNRTKAQQLLEFVEKHPKLDWNKEGSLLVDNNIVEFSHIVDLLHDALNQTKHQPAGHQLFYEHLQHVPRSLITNPQRKSLTGSGGGGGGGGGASTDVPRKRLPPPGIPADAKEPKPLNIWKARWKAL